MPVTKKWGSKKKSFKIRIPESQLIESLKNTETRNLPSTVQKIKDIFGQDHDFFIREIELIGNIEASIIYITSITDKNVISEEVIKPLTECKLDSKVDSEELKRIILKRVLFHADVKTETHLDRIVQALLHGSTLLLIEGVRDVFLINTFQMDKRSIAQPETEQVIRGPRDGFIENISSNTALIRSRLPVPEFRVKTMQVGTLTKSSVAYCYIEGIVNPELVEDVKKRLNSINVDRILDAGYIEQFIQDNPRSPFPQIKSTERPDVVVGNLVEGRVAIMVDGSPFALIVPATFNQFYQTSEDYNERFIMASMIRIIRLIALLFSLIIP
jgi:spore germination protein KA